MAGKDNAHVSDERPTDMSGIATESRQSRDNVVVIGTRLWIKGRNGEFTSTVVNEDTRTSWICDYGLKVDKKTLKTRCNKGYTPRQLYTIAGKLDQEWRQRNHQAIVSAVEFRATTKILKEIAKILGVETK